MSKQKSLAKTVFVIALGKMSTQFLTFLLLPLYTRYLSTQEFGTIDLSLTYIILLTPLATLQLEMATFRYLIDARENEDKKVQIISTAVRTVLIGMAAATIVYLLSVALFPIQYAVYLLGVALATTISNLFLQIARGLGKNVQYSIGGVVAGVTTITLNIALVAGLRMGVEGILLSMFVANVLCALYCFYALHLGRYIRFSYKSSSLRREMLKYSIPLVPNGMAWWAINASDRTVISIVLGVASTGIYAVAYKFPVIFMGLFSFFAMAWTESASLHIKSEDRDKFFSDTFNTSLRVFGSLGLAIVAAIPFVFGVLVDEKFAAAYMYIPILIAGALFSSVVNMYGGVYIAKKLTRQVASTSIMAAIISVAFTLAFIHSLGLYAAALSTVVAYGGMMIYRYFDIKKYVNIHYDLRLVLAILATYIAVFVLYYQQDTWLNALNAALVVAVSLYVNRNTIRVLKNMLLSRRKNKEVPLEAEINV